MSVSKVVRSIMKTAPSFADELRSRSDEELEKLFTLRPDLISPVPAEMTSLSTRAASAPSLVRAIDNLNQWQYEVLEASAAIDEPMTIKSIVNATDKAATEIIEDLIDRALLYRDGDAIRMPRSLRDMIGVQPAGLGPVSQVKINFKELDKAPAAALEILQKLRWGPPRGQVGDVKKPDTPIAWLINKNFLIALDQKTVVMPREVGLHLRGGKVHKEISPTPPLLTGDTRKRTEIDRAAIASLSNILRWVQELMNFWAEETPTALQAGGLGIRDLRKSADHLGVTELCAAFIAEISYLAGLVVIDPDGRILPSSVFDLWQSKNSEDQWRDISSLWVITSRVAGLIGRPESKNITALGMELDRSQAATIRKHILTMLVLHENIAPLLASAQAYIGWVYPHRRGISLTNDLVEWTLRECEWLGITAAGALSSFGKKFLNEEGKLNINESLPKPVDHILIQADNTAIAPGPLTIEIARHLSTFADIESRGGATVYRFSESSIRRGLDHGHSGEEIRTFLAKTSKTPLPQPLDYLISDVGKKHGRLRVGYANSYLRCEDEATVKQILGDKTLEHLRLRQIAPQVLISESENQETIEDLRSAGYFPAAENAAGSVLNVPGQTRAKSRPRPPRIIGEISQPSATILKSAVRALRAGERASTKKFVNTSGIPRNTANETMDILNEYLEKNISLSIGYADTNGGVTQRIIDPISISMGVLIARDHGTGEVQHFRIPRITGVSTA